MAHLTWTNSAFLSACLTCIAASAATACVDTSEPYGGSMEGDADELDQDEPSEAGEVTAYAAEMLAACGTPEASGHIVLGYAPSWGDFNALTASLDLETLTHVALAFTNPTGPGETTELPWVEDDDLHAFVTRAHDQGVKVIASIGGAAESDLIRAKLEPGTIDAYVEELAGFLEKFDLDGVDVDIEGGEVDETYGPLVTKIAARIRPQGKIISAAVAQWFQDRVVDDALFCFDFINEMSYDAAGGWSDPGEHAARSFARSRASYWTAERMYPADRVVIGVPFYGYCWGSGCPRDGSQIPFRQIANLYPDMVDADWVIDEEKDVEINFNGIDTLEYKSEFAKNYGGIMIWDMSQDDSQGQLFEAIRRKL